MTDSSGSLPGDAISSMSMAVASSTLGSITGTQTDTPYEPSSGPIHSHQSVVFSITLIFLCLSFVSVTLRVVARAGIVRKMRPDDWTIVAAWVLSFGMCFSICLGTRYGFGRHLADIPTAWRPAKQRCRYAFTLLYNPAITVTKVSILIFYLLVFKVQRLFRIFCYITLGILIATGLTLTFLLAFECHPISLAWETSLPPTQFCFNTITIYYASAPVNIITDLAILVLPMPVLTSLRLPRKQKAILIIVFGLGVFVLIVGIVRIYYFQVAASSTTTNAGGISTNDFDYQAALSFMWAALEVNVGIICASVPMTKPLIHRFFPTWLGGSAHHHSTVENATVIDYNSQNSGTEPQLSFAQALAPPTPGLSSRPAWLTASGGVGGVVGNLGEVDEEGRIGQSSAQRSYTGHHLRVPQVRQPDEISLTESEMRYIGEGEKVRESDPGRSASTSATQTEEARPTQRSIETPPWEKMDVDFMS